MSSKEATTCSPRRLPTLVYKGKIWTVDERLGEFMYVEFGQTPKYVPLESMLGLKLVKQVVREEFLHQ